MKSEAQIERDWIRESKKNPEAFEPLFNKYYSPIFNYILRRVGETAPAKDITANTFLKALENIQRFQWKGVRFSSWLYRIATNEINQHYRKNKRSVSRAPEIMAAIKSDASADDALLAAEEAKLKSEQFRKIHAAIAGLKPKYQAAVTLRYFENFTLKEIADILEIPENTVKTHIRRGLEKLKDAL